MADYQVVDSEISRLRDILADHPAFEPEATDFKKAWEQVKVTGRAFKGTRYPSREEHDRAWSDFQELVEEVKRRQALQQKEWERRKDRSSRLRDEIVSVANSIRVPGMLDEVVFTIASLGVNKVLEAFMGPFDDRKQLLLELNEQMKKGWRLLSEHKEEMMGQDKKQAWEALNEAKERLDAGWQDYKRERERAWEVHQAQRRANEAEWRARRTRHLDQLEQRRAKLYDVLAHKERHLEELQDKLREAWSDSFRIRVASWIEEEADKMRDIRRKVAEIEGWIEEEREQLSR